jgi:probable rRNA maturation factor
MAVDVVIEDARWKTLELKQIANQAFFETLLLLDLHHKSYACCVLACDNRQIKQLNNKFRGKNCPTNVLSFPASLENYETKNTLTPGEANNSHELGDIAIAFDICKKEATKSKVKFEHHVYHLIIHSVLHLLGFDHEEEENATKMEKIEVQVLAKLGISNPYL